MSRLLAIVALALVSSPAAAEGITPHGWTAAGAIVIEVTGGGASWAGTEKHFFGACSPRPFDDKGYVASDCKLCGAGAADPVAACGATKTKQPATRWVSFDKRVKLTKSVACSMNGHDLDMRMCTQGIAIDRLGVVARTDQTNQGFTASVAKTWFRPDSGAVLVTFIGGATDEYHVIDLGEITARDKVPADVAALVERQLRSLRGDTAVTVYAPDATFFTDDTTRGAVIAGELAKVIGGADAAIDAIASFDGSAAWIAFRVTAGGKTYRASELAMKTGATWTIAAGLVSRGLADADANARAKAGLPAPVELARKRQDLPASISVIGSILRDGDPELARHFGKRARTIAIGTAPAERVVGNLAAAWKSWLAGGFGGQRVRGALASRGTTGWLVTNLQVKRPGYTIPVRVFAIVDRTADRDVFEVVATHAAVAY